MKKEFLLIESINIIKYFNNLTEEKKNALPLKVYYNLKKVISKMTPDVQQFEEFRDNELQKIKEAYFVDEKSDECMIPKLDAEGNEMKDADGNVITEAGRKLKAEYEESYRYAINALEENLREIVKEKNVYEYNYVDVAEMVDNLPDDTPLDTLDIDILDAIFGNDK